MSVEVKVALPTRCVLGEGLHWDGRHNLLLFVDIHSRRVFCFDPDTRELRRRDVPEPVGWILSTETDGRVWIAHWGAGKVCRYDIHGNRVFTVRIPTTNVTNVCFGGRDMTRMFVTSASYGLDDAQRDSEVNAGALFEICGLSARGLPSWQLRI